MAKAGPALQVSAKVTKAVQVASAESGVDFSYLLAKAAVESNLDPKAKAPGSSATGLFQFIDSTWLAMVREHGAEHGYGDYAEAIDSGKMSSKMRREILDLRYDPLASATMAAEYTKENRRILERKLGGEIGRADLYLAHFLGAGGATKFLKAMRADPDQSAAALFPGAARANKAVFYEKGQPCSLAEIRDKFAAKIDRLCEQTTVGEPSSAGQTLTAAAASPTENLFNSLYFPALADAPSGSLTAPRDWAFLRPTGSARPLLPVGDASTLPSNLNFTVQMALAALDAPGLYGGRSYELASNG
jgi:hypothetical protein